MKDESRMDWTSAEYLLDPPETVWEGILGVDHATWLEVKDLAVLRGAQAHVRACGGEIVREAWLGLYASTNPMKARPPEGLEIAHGLLVRAERMPAWTSLRASIVADEIAAAFGAAHFTIELIERLPPEIRQRAEQVQEARERTEELQGRAQALRMLAGAGDSREGGGAGQRDLARLEQAIQEADAEARSLTREALQAMKQAEARLAKAAAESLQAARASLSQLRAAAKAFGVGWGLGPGAGPTRRQLEGLHELAAFLERSEHLRRVLDSLGWAERLVSAERRKSRRGREHFTHYQVQELDLETIAPEELMGWMAPDQGSPLWIDFLRRALDGELLHRRYEGEDETGRGPFVMLIDKSGSMHGLPNATACALELALMKLALQQNRRFVCIPFSGAGQHDIYDPGPNPDPGELVRHLELFYGGGTEPYGPLAKAIRLIRGDPSLREGDILILTDGAFAPPPQAFLEDLAEAREEPGLKIVAVVLGENPGRAAFADEVVLIQDLLQERDQLERAVAALL